MTRQELDSFHQFAAAQLEQPEPPSLEECLKRWRATREYEETVAALQQASVESEAGMGMSLDQAERLILEELGVPAQNQ